MGTIASVLQWKCETCSKINPTEKSCCFNCGSKRTRDAATETVRPLSSPVSILSEENNRIESKSHQQLKHSSSYSNTLGIKNWSLYYLILESKCSFTFVGKWTCPQCSFLNLARLVLNWFLITFPQYNSLFWNSLFSAQDCLTCMESKPKGKGPSRLHQKTIERPNNNSSTAWACKRCTFSNFVDLNVCEVCEAPRTPNIPLTLPRKPIVITYGTIGLDSDNK